MRAHIWLAGSSVLYEPLRNKRFYPENIIVIYGTKCCLTKNNRRAVCLTNTIVRRRRNAIVSRAPWSVGWRRRRVRPLSWRRFFSLHFGVETFGRNVPRTTRNTVLDTALAIRNRRRLGYTHGRTGPPRIDNDYIIFGRRGRRATPLGELARTTPRNGHRIVYVPRPELWTDNIILRSKVRRR